MDYLTSLVDGLVITLVITIAAYATSIVIALPAGLVSKSALLRALITVYVELFRGTSAVVQLFWIFYVLPILGIRIDPIPAAIVAIGLNIGAYSVETIRAAAATVPRGQREAAQSLGLSRYQLTLLVTLPQVIRKIIPMQTNLLIDTLKLSSIVSLITIQDLTFSANTLSQTTGSFWLPYAIAMLFYWLVTLIFSAAGRRVEVFLKVP
ncbi:amino acid ABC transporter permease [Rhizobium hainanense]|uniref:Polar amino acid transport system permease protein n=1 Tax=Rhizobium hainanense TaxID=52131 RepID=A0A1C3WCR9_9HYPH|nr:amino acid ABC transporter permease [Rhizobium hainanense]SCB37665.1 polar amino acid transport system permease protein [Rhizobium hainanense]